MDNCTKINADSFRQFVDAVDRSPAVWSEYATLVNAMTVGNKSVKAAIDRFDRDFKERPQRECLTQYVANLEKYPDHKAEYFNDLRAAATEDDHYLIEILLRVPTKLPLLDPAIDIFLLRYLLSFFKRSNDDKANSYAKYLFEQVLDTADHFLEEYIEFVDELFSLGKDPAWYDDFYDQINKLIYIAPVCEQTLAAVKKGLVVTTEGIRSDIQDYIGAKY